jgi:DNA polymerase I-like protein with 3'-5' exonuclease and polymerase domains
MIYYIGDNTLDSYPVSEWGDFLKWVFLKRSVEFDIETTVTNYWCDKKIMTVQFGDVDDQWVIQWPILSTQRKHTIKCILEDQQVEKIIHNALFECTVCLFHGIRIRNVFDTMLAEQVRYGGDRVFIGYSLAELCQRRLKIELDKTYQTAFGDGQLDAPRIQYAAQDVMYLSLLKKMIYQECQQLGLEWVVALENEAILMFSEMTYNGMLIDVDHWMAQLDKVEPLVNAARKKLDDWLLTPEFRSTAEELGYISNEDRLLLNLNSPKQKKLIFDEFFPELPGVTKTVLQKYMSTKMKKGESYPDWMNYYLEGDMSYLNQYLLTHHRDWLIQHELIIPAGAVSINWSSQKQVLPIMQIADPKVTDLSAETMGRVSHPIFVDFEEYMDTAKLASAFGAKWIEKYVEPDGRVRTTFNSVMTTGRTSSSNPNVQQIPAKQSVGNAYRHAFIPDYGFKFISTDYVSEELVIVAYLSNENVWLEALIKEQDLHSICAELVFGKKWKEAATPDKCEYYSAHVDKKGKYWPTNSKLKCECKKHKYMRNNVKTISFGLIYGMSKFKLAASLRITVPEADQLMHDYFKAFPKLKALLDFLGNFGVSNGYIQTIAPFFRKRFFPYWHHNVRFIEGHIKGVQYHPGLGEIDRASRNMPIQGTASDLMKVALCMLYWYVFEERTDLIGRVKFQMQVHDQVDTTADEEIAQEWKQIQNSILEKAGAFIIKSGILKAETNVTDRWEK